MDWTWDAEASIGHDEEQVGDCQGNCTLEDGIVLTIINNCIYSGEEEEPI